jgi:hypothetical protein
MRSESTSLPAQGCRHAASVVERDGHMCHIAPIGYLCREKAKRHYSLMSGSNPEHREMVVKITEISSRRFRARMPRVGESP